MFISSLDEELIKRVEDNDPTLTMISLCQEIEHRLVIRFAEALKTNTFVTHLHNISDDLLEALDQDLKLYSRITNLKIIGPLRNETVIAFAKALETNKTIKQLMISQFTGEQEIMVLKVLKVNSAIVDINLGYDRIFLGYDRISGYYSKNYKVECELLKAIHDNCIITACHHALPFNHLGQAIKSNQAFLAQSIVALKSGDKLNGQQEKTLQAHVNYHGITLQIHVNDPGITASYESEWLCYQAKLLRIISSNLGEVPSIFSTDPKLISKDVFNSIS